MYDNFNTLTPVSGFDAYTTISSIPTTKTESHSDFHCCNWFGLYNYLVVLFVLLTGLCILLGKVIIKVRRRKYRLLQPARQRAQANGTACSTPNQPASNGTAISTLDNPPTYENAMANYIDAKQQLRAMEEGAMDNAIAMTASTTTIETCTTEVAASRTDLSANTAVATNTGNEASRPALS